MTLIDLKNYLNSLLEAFSNVMNLEMTIINKDPLVRVASTGEYYKLNQITTQENGTVTDLFARSYTMQVLKSGQPLIQLRAEDSLDPRLAQDFDHRYYSIILYPIAIQQDVEGVIVIASFDKTQQSVILQKQDQLLRYLHALSDLIASKMAEEILLKQVQDANTQMNSILEVIQDGLILYSPQNGILKINTCAKEYLHYQDAEVRNPVLKKILTFARTSVEEKMSGLTVLQVNVNKMTFSYQVRTLIIPGEIISVLCIINPYSQIIDNLVQSDEKTKISENIVYSGSKMRMLMSQVATVSEKKIDVLITGESGTGKELIARYIHTHSSRSSSPFISVNCAAIPEALLESELFGYAEGAFTGAKRGGKIGKFLLANRGTLFLDEIGELPLYMQAKLLRVLSERKIDPVGGINQIAVDVRVIGATNRNLEKMIANNEFREDLFYRLNIIPIHIPPLRERKEDLFILTRTFIRKYNTILQIHIRDISVEALQQLSLYDWPGNIRELENTIEYMMTFCKSNTLNVEDIPTRIREAVSIRPTPQNSRHLIQPLKKSVAELERSILEEMNRQYGGSPTRGEILEICHTLGISMASYYRKLKVESDV